MLPWGEGLSAEVNDPTPEGQPEDEDDLQDMSFGHKTASC